MITAAQLRASRALLGIDQRQLAERSGLSLPTIQRMEASEGVIRGNVDSLMKLVEALAAAGIELRGGAPEGGSVMALLPLSSAAVLMATAALAVLLADLARGRHLVYGICLVVS